MATGELTSCVLNSAKTLLTRTYEGGYVSWYFWCPACKASHLFSNRMSGGGQGWDFDGNAELPTFNPSLGYLDGIKCHLFLKAGVIEYCDDCPHEMRGQKVALSPIPATEIEFLLKVTTPCLG